MYMYGVYMYRCVYVCIYIYMLREKERGVSAIFHSLHYQKTRRSKFLLHLNDMESFPKLYSAMVVRNYGKLLLNVYSR